MTLNFSFLNLMNFIYRFSLLSHLITVFLKIINKIKVITNGETKT